MPDAVARRWVLGPFWGHRSYVALCPFMLGLPTRAGVCHVVQIRKQVYFQRRSKFGELGSMFFRRIATVGTDVPSKSEGRANEKREPWPDYALHQQAVVRPAVVHPAHLAFR